MSPLFRLLLPLLLLSLVGLVGVPNAAADGPELHTAGARFLGCYDFSGGESEVRSLRGTVDALVDRFNVLLRGVARRRLERSVRVPERIEIRPDEQGIRLDVIGAPGFPHQVEYESGDLVLRQSSFEGRRETRFRLSEDGRRLSMQVITRSQLLPAQLDYQLTFSRSPARSPARSPGALADSAAAVQVSSGPPGS